MVHIRLLGSVRRFRTDAASQIRRLRQIRCLRTDAASQIRRLRADLLLRFFFESAPQINDRKSVDNSADNSKLVLWIASPLSEKRIQNLNRTNQIAEITCSHVCSQFLKGLEQILSPSFTPMSCARVFFNWHLVPHTRKLRHDALT